MSIRPERGLSEARKRVATPAAADGRRRSHVVDAGWRRLTGARPPFRARSHPRERLRPPPAPARAPADPDPTVRGPPSGQAGAAGRELRERPRLRAKSTAAAERSES